MHQSFLSKLSFELGIDNIIKNPTTPSTEKSTISKKTHIFWQGNNKFYLNGKIILGPNSEIIYSQVFLLSIFIFSLFFYFIILPGLEKTIYHKYEYGFTIFLFLFLIFYILTAITEPGYLPHSNLLRVPKTLNFENQENKDIIKIISDKEDYDFNNNSKNDKNSFEIKKNSKNSKIEKSEIKEKKQHDSISADIENQNHQPKIKLLIQKKKKTPSESSLIINGKTYCNICKIYKLERTHHCSTCNSCVRVHSHHCEITNCCIGKRNYKYFLFMIFFGFCLNLYFISSWIMFYQRFIISGAFFYGFLLWIFMAHCIFLFTYCLFHVFLVFVFGQTTREFVEEDDFGRDFKERFDWFFKSDSLVKFGEDVEYNKQCFLFRDC